MLATRPLVNQFPGAVPALLVWAKGESERLPDLAASSSAEAASLLHALALAVDARDAQRVRQAACHLHGILGKLGVPQLCTAATTLEYLGRTNDLGPAAPMVEELGAVLNGFCAYLAKKPWLRC